MITLRAGLLALAVLVGAVPAGAEEPYPARPVTIVVPFPPGGIADVTARPLAAALERGLKQPVVVTNKAGAAGAVGMQSVAVAKPDGYTLLLGKHAALWASPPALAIPHVKAGKLRALATWGATRLAAFPEVPTLKELGFDVEWVESK
jgi:tripartite-type tricarboxylate transporter receptor subunit TctC